MSPSLGPSSATISAKSVGSWRIGCRGSSTCARSLSPPSGPMATWTKTTAAPAARKESASRTALAITSAVARGSAGKAMMPRCRSIRTSAVLLGSSWVTGMGASFKWWIAVDRTPVVERHWCQDPVRVVSGLAIHVHVARATKRHEDLLLVILHLVVLVAGLGD